MEGGPICLGIDIGGTKIAGALVTNDGRVVTRDQRPTDSHLGGAHVLAAAIDLARGLARQSAAHLTAIGVGAGGQIDAETGTVVSATDVLPGWGGTDIGGAFRREFGVPVAVDNDVNALAVGEARFGAACGKRIAAFLALGTGVGGALVIEGQIYHGAHCSAGEFGHLLIDTGPDARIDTGGASGTLEAYVSGSGLVATYRELSGSTVSGLTGYDVAAEAEREPLGPASAAITRTGQYLGLGLVSLANILDPDLFVVGGGLASLGDRLLVPALAVLRERAMAGTASCPVVTASLGEDASVLGAACLGMRIAKQAQSHDGLETVVT